MRAEGVPGGRAARAATGGRQEAEGSKSKQKRARWEPMQSQMLHTVSTAP